MQIRAVTVEDLQQFNSGFGVGQVDVVAIHNNPDTLRGINFFSYISNSHFRLYWKKRTSPALCALVIVKSQLFRKELKLLLPRAYK